MRNRVALKMSLSRALLLAVAAIAALAGPILIGVVNVKAAGTQAEPAITAVASPVGIAAEERPVTPPIAPFQRGGGGPQGGAVAPGVLQEYRLGEVRVTGNKVLHSDLILSRLGLVSGDVYDELRLREGFKDLMKLYGSLGYVNFLPEPALDFDEQKKVANLTVKVDEGRQFTVNRIGFTGSPMTNNETIRREILIKEGEVFNVSLLELSLSRLNQLGFFEEIKIEEVRFSHSEGKVDINLRVTEKRR